MQNSWKTFILVLTLIVGWAAVGAVAVHAAELPPSPAWARTYSGIAKGDDRARAFAVDFLGNTYVTGLSEGDFATVKYDPDGNELWVARYAGSYGGWDIPYGVATDDAGGVYVFGKSEHSGSEVDHVTLKYDAEGNRLWESRYSAAGSIFYQGGVAVDSSGNSYVFGGYAIKQDPDGNILWSAPVGPSFREIRVDGNGNVYLAGGSGDMITLKFDTYGNELWVAYYDGPIGRYDEAVSLAVDDFGNAYITGRSMTRDEVEGYDYATVKYDPDGNEVWVARYNGPDDGEDVPRCVTVDSGGNVYVTGLITGSTPYDHEMATVKYDASGNELWSDIYDGGEYGRYLAVDAVGNLYVAGYSDEVGLQWAFLMVKYGPNGDELWATQAALGYDGSGLVGLHLDPSDRPIICGYFRDAYEVKTDDYITLQMDEDGNLLWTARYDSARTGHDQVGAMAVDHDGNVIVGGSLEVTGPYDSDSLTVKYSPDGEILWTARHEGLGGFQDKVTALIVDAEDNIIVAGYGDSEYAAYEGVTIKYDPDGNELWVARAYDLAQGFGRPVGVATDASGNAYVAGNVAVSYRVYDMVAAKYDPNGNELWARRFEGTVGGDCNDFVEALVLDPAGNVYLTGTSCDDSATLKYDSNGNLLWVALYDGPGGGEDSGRAIVRTSSHLYVTGRSQGIETGPDIVTIKYDLDGNEIWVARYGRDIAAGEEAPCAMVMSGGDLYVAGESDADYVVIKYNQYGEELWVASYEPGINVPYDMIGDRNGGVIVTGLSTFLALPRICTVRYDEHGRQLWVDCYDGPVMGYGVKMEAGLQPGATWTDGSFYLAATGIGADDSADFLTIKYSPATYLWSAATVDTRSVGSVPPETSKILCAILSLLVPLFIVILRLGLRQGKG